MATSHGLSVLPDDVLVDILARLPVRCVGRCRAVCSAWRAATSTASFDRALAARRPPAAAATVTPVYPIRYRHAESVRFAFAACRWYEDNLRERGPRPSALPLSGVAGKVASAEAIGSWDAIGCSVSYLLWNPLTGAWTTVSAPAGHGRVIGGYAHQIHAYSVRYKWWGNVGVADKASLVMHRDSVLPGEVSFGDAARLLPVPPHGTTLRQRR